MYSPPFVLLVYVFNVKSKIGSEMKNTTAIGKRCNLSLKTLGLKFSFSDLHINIDNDYRTSHALALFLCVMLYYDTIYFIPVRLQMNDEIGVYYDTLPS